MSFRGGRSMPSLGGRGQPGCWLLLGLMRRLLSWQPMLAVAQRGFGGGGSVGGVQIDAEGLLKNATVAQVNVLEQLRQESLEPIPGDLKRPPNCARFRSAGWKPSWQRGKRPASRWTTPCDYLAGLQRIRYVFVYPEQNDIVVAGFAEGWKIDARGNTVGASSGRPCMLLDDLIVALRTVRAGRATSAARSIPRPKGWPGCTITPPR